MTKRKKAKYRPWWEEFKEAKKSHHLVPDFEIGERQERDADGQLTIYLKRGLIPTPYVVVGKYAEPRDDGTEWYVADWTQPGVNPTTSYHDNIIMALARIHELIEANDRVHNQLWAGRNLTKG